MSIARVYCDVCDTTVEVRDDGELSCGHTDYEHDYLDADCGEEYKPLNFDED